MHFAVTLSIRLACTPARAQAFLADPHNWPSWSVPFCHAVSAHHDGSWLIRSSAGNGRLFLDRDGDTLVCREIFEEGEWQLRCRCIPDGDGTLVEMSIPRPDFSDNAIYGDFIEMARLRLKRLQTALAA